MIEVPSFADVQAAAKRIAPYAVRTPLVESPILSALTGGRVFLKLESLQRTGSFKFRGACNRILMIPEAQRAKGVVAFLVRQSCPGRGGGSTAVRHSCLDRDAQ